MSHLENLLQKLIEERRIARENTDNKSEEFIKDRTNEKLAELKTSSLLCYGMFNQQFVIEEKPY